jgi:hypothetical protein
MTNVGYSAFLWLSLIMILGLMKLFYKMSFLILVLLQAPTTMAMWLPLPPQPLECITAMWGGGRRVCSWTFLSEIKGTQVIWNGVEHSCSFWLWWKKQAETRNISGACETAQISLCAYNRQVQLSNSIFHCGMCKWSVVNKWANCEVTVVEWRSSNVLCVCSDVKKRTVITSVKFGHHNQDCNL